jgi:plastocyanin
MLGTWMTANVFLRIIPRQLKMVESAKKGEPVNQEWAKNAKNRSTHNTYFTLPVIFIMLSNHFPNTYGNAYNWQILIAISAAGAAIREFFVVRLSQPMRSRRFGVLGAAIILGVMFLTRENTGSSPAPGSELHPKTEVPTPAQTPPPVSGPHGNLKGAVRYAGIPQKPEVLSVPAVCNPGGKPEVLSNDILIFDGKVKNVLVSITSGLTETDFGAPPAETAILDQKDCQYEPRLLAVRVGQKVDFLNSDPTFHNVKSLSKFNENFNIAMPSKNDKMTKVFSKPEIFIESKCSVHPWMSASIAVLDHPYFSVTGASGEFSIPNLPTGTYTLEAWHEVFGTLKQTIIVKENETLNLEFKYGK